MTKVKVKYIGKYQPQDITEVEKDRAELLIKTGDYEYVENKSISRTRKKKRSFVKNKRNEISEELSTEPETNETTSSE